MIRLFDFRCDTSGKVFERFVQNTPDMIVCECGGVAKRIISPVRCKLDHTFPGEADKWARKHEKGAKQGKQD